MHLQEEHPQPAACRTLLMHTIGHMHALQTTASPPSHHAGVNSCTTSQDDKVPPVGSISSNGTPSSPLVSKLGGHLLPEGRRASMPGLSMLPGVPPAPQGPGAPTTGWGSPGSESPPTGLSPKPPGVPSRNTSGPRPQSLLNPERSGGTGSLRDTERLGSTGGASFDPLDPSLPPWVPQVRSSQGPGEVWKCGGRCGG